MPPAGGGSPVAGPVDVLLSKHLGVLKQAGLVEWTRRMEDFWEARLDGLEDLLKRMDQ